MLTLLTTPPFCTVQDLGRTGWRAEGVPLSGAMDPVALQAANDLVGNEPGAAGLEWALGGGRLRIEGATALAITGVAAEVRLNGNAVPLWTTLSAQAGDELEIRRLVAGRYLYLAVAGGLAVPALMGSRSTYLPGGFGGYEGRRLQAGDVLPVGTRPAAVPAVGTVWPSTRRPDYGRTRLRVLPGPQAALFDEAAWRTLTSARYVVTPAGDRTGYRLEGPIITCRVEAALPSEAACPGAIQVPAAGQPIVLMADAPTVGGYPKIGVVIAADLPVLAQKRPGETVAFETVTLAEAQAARPIG